MKYEHNQIAACPHGEVLHVLAPVGTRVEMTFTFPDGCSLTAKGAIRTESKVAPAVARRPSVFDRKVKPVDWGVRA